MNNNVIIPNAFVMYADPYRNKYSVNNHVITNLVHNWMKQNIHK